MLTSLFIEFAIQHSTEVDTVQLKPNTMQLCVLTALNSAKSDDAQGGSRREDERRRCMVYGSVP